MCIGALYCCGLRPNEALLIQAEDIDPSTGQMYIRESKRHKDRVVMLSKDLLGLCRRYDQLRRQHIGNGSYFFSKNGEQPYNTAWLEYQFRKAWKNARIKECAGPTPRVYDFRHTFATRKLYEWMEKKEDLFNRLPYLSAYMGHRQFSSTAYYIHLLPQRLISRAGMDVESFESLLPEVSK